MADAKTTPAKYVFLDVVSFSRGRSVEAQSDIVHSLNDIVKESLIANNITPERRILLPTGYGFCIALLNIEEPFDIHVRLAIGILRLLQEYNANVGDQSRRFEIRIGLNANIDNLVTDINGNQNIAGYGINTAQRVMSNADGNQILVGRSVFEILRAREAYMKCFRSYSAVTKNGETLGVHQLIDDTREGLNVDVPVAFRKEIKTETKLTFLVACYFARALVLRGFLVEQKETGSAEKIILLWFLARDTVYEIESKGLTSYPRMTYRAGKATLEEQLEFYSKMHIGVEWELQKFIEARLYDYYQYFEDGHFWLVNDKGNKKLKEEWPEIWQQFNLDNT